MFGISIDFTGWLNQIATWILEPVKAVVSWLLGQAWAFIQWLWSLAPLPTSWPGPNVLSGVNLVLSTIAQPLSAVNYYCPINLAFVLIATVLLEEAALGAWHGLRWLIAHLPWVGGEV